MKKFNQFCRDTNFAMQGTVNQNTLCYFVAYLAKHNLSPATIKVYLSALRYHHIANDLPEPNRLNMPKLKIMSNGVTKVAAKTLSQKTARLPITPDILRRVYKLWLPRSFEYETIMMWAASTLCFFGFFRMGELTIANNTAFDQSVHLTPADVAVDSHTNPTMIQVHLKTSKTDRQCVGVTVTVGKTDDELCPVSAVLAYLAKRGASQGPLFTTSEGLPLTKSRFVLQFREALTQIGIDASKYTGHSFRIGAATTAAEQGIEDSTIQLLGRWKSTAYLTYVRPPADHLAKMCKIMSKAKQ